MGKTFVILIFFLCAFLVFCGVSNLVTLKFFDVTSGVLSVFVNTVDVVTMPFDWIFRSQFLPDLDEYGFRDTDVICVTRFVFYQDAEGNELEEPVYIDAVLDNFGNKVVYSNDPEVRAVGKTVFGKYVFKSVYYDENGGAHEGAILYSEDLWSNGKNSIGTTEEITYQFYKHQVKFNDEYFG